MAVSHGLKRRLKDSEALGPPVFCGLETLLGNVRINYEDWSIRDLYEKAQELEIEGRAYMSKLQLIEAIKLTYRSKRFHAKY